MKWVTRDHVHLDRVATPWLIRRFIDPSAEFVFVSFAGGGEFPDDAIAFGIPGIGVGAHDAAGSAFRKVMCKYNVSDRALDLMAEIVESGIELAKAPGATVQHAEGAGLNSLSIGMAYLASGDSDNLVRSTAIYDALYSYCRGVLALDANDELRALKPPKQWEGVRALLEAEDRNAESPEFSA